MTIRQKVEEESPDGHVLFIEDLRKCLGIGSSDYEIPASSEASASVGPTRPYGEVLLIGHDLRGDFPKMRAEGIEFNPYLHYVGCIDTHVIIEDTCERHFGKSLSRLMEYYGLAKGRIVRPRNLPASKAKFVFFGGHNAGNDAIATLKVAVAQAFDSEIKRSSYGESENEDDLTDEFLNKPLRGMSTSMILLAYDSEGVESNRYDRQRRPIGPATTEHGFAWLNLAEVADIPPGKNGINWHTYIRARHWLNWEYRNFANFKYVVGDPLGFWKEFGETQYYHESEGPAPFHQLFRELASAVVVKESSGVTDFATTEGITAVQEISKSPGNTTIGQSLPDFESNPVEIRGEIPNFRGKNQNYRGKQTSNRGKNPNVRGNIAGGRENMTNQRGNRPNFSSNVAPTEGFFSNPKGQILSSGGNAPTKQGKEPNFYDSVASRGEHTPTIRGKNPNFSKSMTPGGGNLPTNQGKEPKLYNSMAPGGANTPTNKGKNPSFSNSMASGGGNATMYRGKGPNSDGSVASDGGSTVKNKGNEPIFSNNMASGGGNMATKTGKRPSWAQIARDTPSGASK